VGTGVVLVVVVGGGIVVVGAGAVVVAVVELHAARTTRAIINVKTSKCLLPTENMFFIVFLLNQVNYKVR
jgi:hypothetical protein